MAFDQWPSVFAAAAAAAAREPLFISLQQHLMNIVVYPVFHKAKYAAHQASIGKQDPKL